MDVLFVNPNSSAKNYQGLANLYSAIEPPTWSLLLAAALRKKGFGVGILDCDAERLDTLQAVERIRDANPRLVCFVTYGQNPNSGTTNMIGTLELAKSLKEIYNFPTMSIGTHTSALPHEVLNTGYFDFVAINEGMRTLVQLLDTDLKTDLHLVKGLGYLENGKPRVNNGVGTIVPTSLMDEEYPGYAWDLLPYKNKPLDLYRSHFWHTNYEHEGRTPFAAIYTSLGCQFFCEFCCINVINRESEQEETHAAHSNQMRFWSPSWAFNVVKDLVENYGVETLRFSDEMFTLNKKYYVPLLEKIVEAGYGERLRTWAYARVDTVIPKNLDLMRRSGIRFLGIGIECGDQKIRQEIDKGRFREVNIRGVREELRSHDINGGLNYIFGFPNENYAELEATRSLMFELMGEFTNIYCASALPGSPLYFTALENNWELPQTLDGYGFYSYNHVPLRTHHLTAAEVLKFRDETWKAYYTNPTYLSFIEKKFGKVARSNIEDQTKIQLKRRLLGD